MIRKLKDNVWWNGVFDRALETFDIIMTTEFGTTYNAYTVKGSEKTALVETAKKSFQTEYFDNLKELLGDGKIDYIIVNHTEPDHSGSLEDLIRLHPDVEVVGSTAALNFVKEIINRPFNAHPVRDGDEISLGDKTLRFIAAPNLHWPDSMYTYLVEDRLLFTCDSFGAHYGAEDIMRSDVRNEADYMKAAKYYFDMILGPFKPFMLKAIEKIEPLQIDMICTGHGPVLDTKIPELIDIYRDWCRDENPNGGKTVVIAYVSAYGYTRRMAQLIAQGIEEAGAAVQMYDLVEDDRSTLFDALYYADGVLLGSPTILGDALKPIYDLSTTMLPTVHGGKQAAAFDSYGWTGEAVPNLTERLRQLKMKVTDGLRFKFKPSEDEEAQCIAFGREFGKKVLG